MGKGNQVKTCIMFVFALTASGALDLSFRTRLKPSACGFVEVPKNKLRCTGHAYTYIYICILCIFALHSLGVHVHFAILPYNAHTHTHTITPALRPRPATQKAIPILAGRSSLSIDHWKAMAPRCVMASRCLTWADP